jgi:hypothetical protein
VHWLEARYGNLPTFADWQPNRYQSASFSEERFERWWERVTDATFASAAVYQTAQAWVGAIRDGDGRAGKGEPTTFEELRDFLAAFGLPLFPATMSTPSLAAVLGIKL